MAKKQIIGLVVLIIGVLSLMVALYARSRVAQVRSDVNTATGFFSNNPVNKGISSAMESKLGSYNAPIMLGTVGGIILILVGAGIMLYGRRR